MPSAGARRAVTLLFTGCSNRQRERNSLSVLITALSP